MSRAIWLVLVTLSAVCPVFALGGSTCATATEVGALPYSDGGQLDSGFDPNCFGEPVNDLFYRFTAPQTGSFRFDLCGSNDCCDQQLAIWGNGLCCSGSSVIVGDTCADGYPLRELYMLAGQTIYIEIGKSGTEWTDAPQYQFNVTLISDVCPGTIIPALPYLHRGTTLYATHQYNGSCYGGSAPDVVFQYTAPAYQWVQATMLAPWYEALQVRMSNCATGATLICDIGIGADSSQFAFLAFQDSTYYFILDGDDVSGTGYTFKLQDMQDLTVENDVCPGTAISSLPFTDNGSTLFAFHQYNGSCYAQSAPDVVYSFTSPDSVFVRASMVASWFDCMHVRKNNCATGASLHCDFGSGPDSSWFDFWAEPDSTYYFVMDGAFNMDYGAYLFTLQEWPVQNDVCPGTVISGLPFTDNSSTALATNQYTGSCYYDSAPDVVYQFTSTSGTAVRASLTSAGWVGVLQIRKDDCATGASLRCAGGSLLLMELGIEPNSTYYFIVDGGSPWQSGPYTFTLQELPVLQNDECPGTVISSLPYTDYASTDLASHQYNGSCYTQWALDVVYQYTSPDSANMRASMAAPWFECMHVRKNDCEAGASLQCDCGYQTDSSWFDFLAEPDSTYYFVLDGAFNQDYGPYTFTLDALPVQHDICPGIVIPALPYSDDGTTTRASHQYTGGCNTEYTPDVVYQFTSPDSVLLSATVHAGWGECLYVRKNNCETGFSFECDQGVWDSSWFTFWAEPDSTYFFFVDGVIAGPSGPYTFTLREAPVQNDLCPGTVIPALPYSDIGSTLFAVNQYGGCCLATAPDVVYQYTSPDSAILSASMVSMSPGCMQVRKNNCETGAALLCDFGQGADSSRSIFWAEPDSTYYFIVDGASSVEAGSFTFALYVIPEQLDFCPGIAVTALPYSESSSTEFMFDNLADGCCGTFAPDAIYWYQSPDSVQLQATVHASWNDCIRVRKNGCDSRGAFDCGYGLGAESAQITFWTEPDSTYYFIVDGYYDDNFAPHFGPYTFTLTSLSCPAPDSLVIATSGNDAILRWPHVDCDTPLYSIYRNDSLDVQAIPANLIGTTTDSTFTDVDILSGGDLRNFYVVTATN